MTSKPVHVAHTCGCTLLRVGVSGPAQCPTHGRLTEALGSRWPHMAVFMARNVGDRGAIGDEGPRPSDLKGAR